MDILNITNRVNLYFKCSIYVFETILAAFDLWHLHIYIINLNTAAAQVSFGVEISLCENEIFHQRGERVPSFVWNALERILERERVMDAFLTHMEREHSVRLFLSSTAK